MFPRMIATQTILTWMWAGFGVYWFLGAWGTKKIEVNERAAWRLMRWAILAVVFTLLLTARLSYGLLGRRFIPRNQPVEWAGIGLTAAGLLLCAWARHHLGTNWTDKVALKVDHQLIRSGPYARLRHPIYSGVLLGVAGTALAVGEWRGVIALVIMLVNYAVKARREDRILAGRFGDAFLEHKRQAGFLLPKVGG